MRSSPRDYPGMACDETLGVTVLFGGFVSTSFGYEVLADTWEFGGETWTEGKPTR